MTIDNTNFFLTKAENGLLRYETEQIPRINEQSLLLTILSAGICGTDWQILTGERIESAKTFGHEAVAKVIAVGNKIKDFAVGDHVVFLPHLLNNPELIVGHNIAGVFQQKRVVTAEELAGNIIYKIPNTMNCNAAVLAEPLAAVIYSHSLISKMTNAKTVAIFGAGNIGSLYKIYLKLFHPEIKPFLIDSDVSKLEWAIKNRIIDNNNAIPFSAVHNLAVDSAIICTNRSNSHLALEKATAIVNKNGGIDIISGLDNNSILPNSNNFHPNQVRQKNICGAASNGIVESIIVNEKPIKITGHRGVSLPHMKQAINILQQYPQKFMRIITHIIPLVDAPILLNKMIKEKIFHQKVLLA